MYNTADTLEDLDMVEELRFLISRHYSNLSSPKHPHTMPPTSCIPAPRPYSDLIKEIEYNGERFIPAQKIAALAFGYDEAVVENNAKMWRNDTYDFCTWYQFDTTLLMPMTHRCSLGISINLDITLYQVFGDNRSTNTHSFPPVNQAEIFKNLISWGFIQLPPEKTFANPKH